MKYYNMSEIEIQNIFQIKCANLLKIISIPLVIDFFNAF